MTDEPRPRFLIKRDLADKLHEHSVEDVVADFRKVLLETLATAEAGEEPLLLCYATLVGDETKASPTEVRIAGRFMSHPKMRLLLRRVALAAENAGAITPQLRGQIERGTR